MPIIEAQDRNRIEAGIRNAVDLLKALPIEKRGMRGLLASDIGGPSLQALFEGLCCESYHKTKPILLCEVMALIQSTKVLRLGYMVPAMTRFLFDEDENLHRFAVTGYLKIKQEFTKDTFEWVIQDALIDAIKAVNQGLVETAQLPRFWDGVCLIVARLDKDLITHQLRGLEVNPSIYEMTMVHLHTDSEETLRSVLNVFTKLVRGAPQTFWSAFGAASPALLVEQVFNSPAYPDLLKNSLIEDPLHAAELAPATAWTSVAMQSLNGHLQIEACRIMLSALMTRLQKQDFPIPIRMACLQAALNSLDITLSTYTSPDYSISVTTSFIFINKAMELVDTHKDHIVALATLQKATQGYDELAGPALDVVGKTLFLDSSALKAEFLALQKGEKVDHGLNNHSGTFWGTVVDSFTANDMRLAETVLRGITPLIGLEEFKPLKAQSLEPGKARFNKSLSDLADLMATVFERMADFSHENLRSLYQNSVCAQTLFGGLISANSDTHASAISLIKTLTNQNSRGDAIRAVLESFLEQFLSAFIVASKKINFYKTFTAVPVLLKTSGDIVEGLFSTESGILRTKSSISENEHRYLRGWWAEQWIFIRTSFQLIELWSRYHDNSLLKEFLRDAMDFADKLFDQYGILATVMSLPSSDPGAEPPLTTEKAKAFLLEFPSSATSTISGLLRLKDHHLVSTAVRLICKILHRTGDLNIVVKEDTSDFIDKMVYDQVKTNLSSQQKAELKKALEENWGIEEIKPEAVVPKKQGRIDSYYDVGAKNDRQSSSAPSSVHGREIIDLEAHASRPSLPASGSDRRPSSLQASLDQIQARQQQQKVRDQQQQAKIQAARRQPFAPAIGAIKSAESIKLSRQKEKEDKMRRDADAVAKARAMREKAAIVKGEGSGIAGLGGALGKDHAPVKSTMMVSSDESEEEDEDDGTGRRLLTKRVKTPLTEDQKRLKAAMAKQLQGPVKKTKIQRSKADMKARVIPSMTPLHQVVLSWDIFHQGDSPPGTSDADYDKVPQSFQKPEQYTKVMMPLLVAEAWKQLASERENTQGEPFNITVINRMTVDSFMEVSTKMLFSDFNKVSLGRADIVILSRGQNPLNDKDAAHMLARVEKLDKKKEYMDVVYKVSVAAFAKAKHDLSLDPNTKINGFKLASITSLEREFAAMQGLAHFDLLDEILEAAPSPLLKHSDYALQQIQKTYELNRGQAGAILSAKENDAFTLIQGPPGSGKTKTIAALVGALLTDQLKQVQGVAIGRPGQPPAKQQTAVMKKLLVCAPSNAAVDELVSRLMGGVTDMNGNQRKINVLRLGRSDKINANIMSVTLEKLAEKRLEADRSQGLVVSETNQLHERAKKLKDEIAELRPQLQQALTNNDITAKLRLQREIDGRKREQARIGTQIDEKKDSGQTQQRENEIARRNVEREIINGAHVLCSTLSGTGQERFKDYEIDFDTVIIDEAAQSIEISSLIPLKYGCTKAILVGDPKQLPPTVLSNMGARFGYEKSLFVRMQENYPDRIHLLDTQYRMHPEISHFPSKSFYDSKLIDGPGLAKIRAKPWHSKALLGPYQFFDVMGTQGKSGTSLINMAEIHVAIQLYETLRKEYPRYDFKNKVAMITPYKGQLKTLQSTLVRKYGEDILSDIDTNTTDAYQGREAEIIIFSCVRASAGAIGFLNDIRRMNVGLTRAKSSMWVLGDSRSLKSGEWWNKLLQDAKDRKRYIDGDVMGMLKKPLAKALDCSTATDREVEMDDAGTMPIEEKAPEPATEEPQFKHPVRRPSSRDGQDANAQRQNLSASASSASNGQIQNGRTPSIPSRYPSPANGNGLHVRPGMPKLTPVGTAQPVIGKRPREPSPTDSGPPRKVRFLQIKPLLTIR